MTMQFVQASAVGAATTAVLAHAMSQSLTPTAVRSGEHGDGSGRWHVIVEALTAVTEHEVTLRALVNADGTIDPVEVIEGATW